MDNTVNINDSHALPGSSIGIESYDRIVNNAIIIVPRSNQSLSTVGAKIVPAADWHLSSMSDDYRSAKYTIDPSVSYYANGSLSVMPSQGQLVFSKLVNNPGAEALRIDQNASTFSSTAANTTLGSLNIDTKDGHTLNPISPVIPSSNFSPVKPWIESLIPSHFSKTLLTIPILELVQEALMKGPTEESIEYRTSRIRKDLGAIIIDNQEIEDRLFQNRKGT